MARYLPRQERGSETPQEGTCGAKLRLSDPARYCIQPPMRSKRRCRHHGGMSRSGIASGTYGSGSLVAPGGRSKFIPERLASDYARAKNDPERLSLLHDISALAAREQELLRRIDPGDPGSAWGQVTDALAALDASHAAFQAARGSGSVPGMQRALESFSASLSAGRAAATKATTDYGLWQEWMHAVELLAKLRAQEHKRLLELQQVWSSDQVLLFWGQVQQELWVTCSTLLPKEQIRPFLERFKEGLRGIEASFQRR